MVLAKKIGDVLSHLDDSTRLASKLAPYLYLHYVRCDTEIISCVPTHKCFCLLVALGRETNDNQHPLAGGLALPQ